MRNSAGITVRQSSLYVRHTWPINTGALTAAIAAAVLVVGFVIWRLSTGFAGDTAAANTEYRLSHDAITLTGTREKMFALERWKKDAQSGAAVNMLIVSTDEGVSHWMFPDNGQTILVRDELHASDPAGVFSPVTGLVLTVSTGARESLYFYRVGGGPAVRFLTADTVISAEQAGLDRYLVLMRNGTHMTAAVYSLVDFQMVSAKPAPDMPQ